MTHCWGGSLQVVSQILAPCPGAVQLYGEKVVPAGYEEAFGLSKSSEIFLLEFSHDALG